VVVLYVFYKLVGYDKIEPSKDNNIVNLTNANI